MQKPILIYCYDAYCGWCYGFSPVIKKIAEKFSNKLDIEVLSGGMAIGKNALPIEKIASYIKQSYTRVEDYTGIKFGEDFLWHINNPDKSYWIMNSEKPAIALSIFKEILPEEQLNFASDLQYALNYEGRDLDDDEAYRHLIEKYGIPTDTFYTKLKTEEYKEKAYYEFALCKQLQVDSFPQVLLQQNENKFFLVAKGYTPNEQIESSLQKIFAEI
jgi:putative protein-disulfide isomerase